MQVMPEVLWHIQVCFLQQNKKKPGLQQSQNFCSNKDKRYFQPFKADIFSAQGIQRDLKIKKRDMGRVLSVTQHTVGYTCQYIYKQIHK